MSEVNVDVGIPGGREGRCTVEAAETVGGAAREPSTASAVDRAGTTSAAFRA